MDTPVMPIFKKVIAFITILLLSSNAFAEEQLIFAVDVIRHGDRTPVIIIPTSDYQPKEGLGQLTALGMAQEYELGKRVRKYYVDELHFLPENYTPEAIYVHSTDRDRTLMSAQSFLMGLYPPGTGPQSALPGAYQPIPIHTAPSQEDHVIVFWDESEDLKKLIKKDVYETRIWKEKTKELKPKFKRWSQLSGISIKTLDETVKLGNSLYIYQLHGIPLPNKMSKEDAEQIMSAGKWAFSHIYQNQKVARRSVERLLHSIAEDIKQATEKKSIPRYKLFSAHDSTIMSLLSALGAPLDSPPPYASRLHMALFKESPEKHHVKLFLNDKAVAMPACGGTICSLDQFLSLAYE